MGMSGSTGSPRSRAVSAIVGGVPATASGTASARTDASSAASGTQISRCMVRRSVPVGVLRTPPTAQHPLHEVGAAAGGPEVGAELQALDGGSRPDLLVGALVA